MPRQDKAEGLVDFMELKGDVIYDGTRKVHKYGDSKASTLPLFDRLVGRAVKLLRARVIVERDGTINYVLRIIPSEE